MLYYIVLYCIISYHSCTMLCYVIFYIIILYYIIVYYLKQTTANLRIEILDFRGFDSSRVLILRGGSLTPIGNSPELLSQQILVEG